ncbi:hypothetical protein [Burkholderia vietnamiensis]|jgi:hypothetical protein|uniref:hypothetical protein n=1 Tax=Burkholderia vietnamiensis TaxID=60552 RepID=UPI001041A6F9|nr:hypothetical protein [Burkholderia vietnamiensis]
MIDQDKMRALAAKLREWNWLNDAVPQQAADAIDLLLAEVEASDQKRKEAILDAEKARDERNRAHVKLNAEWIEKTNALRVELEAAAADKRRLQWLADRFIGADFEWNADDDGNGAPVLCIKIDRGTKVYGCLTTTVDEALAQRQGEGS